MMYEWNRSYRTACPRPQFVHLPYHLLEEIVDYLSKDDLRRMMRVSRWCSTLTSKSLYSYIPLTNFIHHHKDRNLGPDSELSNHSSSSELLANETETEDDSIILSTKETDPSTIHHLRRKQFSFLLAISQHPEYTRFIRKIEFEFTDNRSEVPTDHRYPIPRELVWRIIGKCRNLVGLYVKLGSHRPGDGLNKVRGMGQIGMFPTGLRRAYFLGLLGEREKAWIEEKLPPGSVVGFSEINHEHSK